LQKLFYLQTANKGFFFYSQHQNHQTPMNIVIINGPNLNLLGRREADIYGSISFEEFLLELKADYPSINFHYVQSNIEGELVDALHRYGFDNSQIILNAGAYTHTSVALHDAIAGIKSPVVEVHISNVHAREQFRHHSLITSKCIGVISGFGLSSYKLAIAFYVSHYTKLQS
jgi:3-dehydroquinate dehydratase II